MTDFLIISPSLLLIFGITIFVIDTKRNHEITAFRRAVFILIVFTGILFSSIMLHLYTFLQILNIFLILLVILLLLPIGKYKNPGIDIVGKIFRVDERDTMFARARYSPGDEDYNDYYSRNPENKSVDDRIRSLPPLGGKGSLYYKKESSEKAEAFFNEIQRLPQELEVDRELLKALRKQPEIAKSLITDFCLEHGAHSVGFSELDRRFLYAFKGRQKDSYGTVPAPDHLTVIIFTVEMSHRAMMNAPGQEVLVESARQYNHAARISIKLAKTLSAAGFDSRSHHDAHYDFILPPIAVQAGLGELGRANILMTPRLGPRVRLGAVSTSLKISADKPIRFGGYEFCLICRKCATSCPSRSLSSEEPRIFNGVKKWNTRQETCYHYWRKIGSDCGICMAVCPFGKPNTISHNLVRFFVVRSHIFRYIALWMDDFFYGRKWKTG